MKVAGIIQDILGFFKKSFHPQAVIRPISSWQVSRICINIGNEVSCKKVATHEAYCHNGKLQASVRCCISIKCKEVAKKIAETSVKAETQS